MRAGKLSEALTSDNAVSRRSITAFLGTAFGLVSTGCVATAEAAESARAPLTTTNGLTQAVAVDESSSPISAFTVVTNVSGNAAVPTNYRTQRFAGLALSAGTAPATITVQTEGFVDTSLVSLGPGLASLVGSDANGNPVRAGDVTCASATNVLGWCDASGAIFLAPATYAGSVVSVDMVLDGGADPTGQADCGVAFAQCVQLIRCWLASPATGPKQPIRGLEIVFGPGRFLFNNPATTGFSYDFIGWGSAIRIRGQRGATLVEVSGLGDSFVFGGLANMMVLEIEDLTFFSTNSADGPDCAGIVETNPAYMTYLRGITCVNIACSNALFYALAPTFVADVEVYACQATSGANGLFYFAGAPRVEIDRLSIIDIGVLNGWPAPGRVGGTSVRVSGPCEAFVMRNSFIDEACNCNLYFDGSSAPISAVDLLAVHINQATLQGGIAGVFASNVQSFRARAVKGATYGAAPYFVLQGVGRAELDMLDPLPGSPAQYQVIADNACGVVALKDAGFPPSKVSSSAAVTTMDTLSSNGPAVTRLFQAGAAISRGQLLKLTATGVVPLTTCDASSVIIGVGYDDVLSGSTVRVATRGQQVAVLADGISPIACGDSVSASSSIASFVGQNTANTIGVAMNAASGLGDLVNILFV
jgi:hypothetical protein